MFSAGRVLLMPKGAYNPLTTYEMLDIVSYNGSSYIAKGTTTGNLPTDTTYWQLSAYGGQAANIAGNFAELESSSVATAIHYVDDIFVDENSQLMKATQTINIGDTIDENVNCTPTTVEALISYLSSYVDSLDSLNKKIQGAIEIAAQTDLHSLAIGEYYKKQSTFYVTNGPTGIDQDPTAIFRLTVEAALDNASQASSPLLLTLRTPDGKIYTQGFDGTSWGSWEQIAVESSVVDVDTRVDSVESSVADVETSSTASKSYAIGKSFYYSDVLYKATAPIPQGGTITPGTNCTPEKIIEKIDDLVSENQTLTQQADAMVNVYGSKNLAPNDAISNNQHGLTLTVNSDKTVVVSGTAEADWSFRLAKFKLKAGTYILSDDNSGSYYTTCYLQVVNEAEDYNIASNANDHEKVFTLQADSVVILRLFYNNGATVNSTFKPMIRDARIVDPTYEPYAMTNQQITPYVQAISNPNLLDNPWFTVNQRGFSTSNTNGFTVDRWQVLQAAGTISLVSGAINIDPTVSGTVFLWGQTIEDAHSKLAGKTVTLSVMLSDGTIKSKSFIYPTDSPRDRQINNVHLGSTHYFELYEYSSGHTRVGYYNDGGAIPSASITIKAIKLELGSVSTLAQDTAPNYATELLKCQRYFENDIIFFKYINGQTIIDNSVAFKVPKRTTPTITVYSNDDTSGNCSVWNGSAFVDKVIDDASVLNNSTARIRISDLSNDYIQYRLQASADL